MTDLVAPRKVLKYRIKNFIERLKPKKSTSKMTDAQLIKYCRKHDISIGRKGGAPKGFKWNKTKTTRVKKESKPKDDKMKNLEKARKVKNAKNLKMDEPKQALPKMDDKKDDASDDDDD